ncbi:MULTISPECIES: type I pullulanase [unclassified Fusibacter]|uniref:type I pullulanase n=1 Tax=unclassified Fusibacter TaxID=2624464 RepID=UPI0010115152|nr:MULTISPECIES: type I pullulanase [unclassified Fusibacter]MCK8058271.1 type I pullulanase [Fusibacter sp. A2]NPE20854.1 type I pullulanase [Fusibacter sp. A1]RXV63058.1 type I pullulanase [Fusibacter sp. A1]
MTFRMYWDDIKKLTAEVDLIYYDGISEGFKIIDEENNYYEVKIEKTTRNTTCIKYDLSVEGLVVGRNYTAVDDRFLKTNVVYRYIVRSTSFDEKYYYDGDLGNFYTPKKTIFKVWSPVATRMLTDIKGLGTFEMTRNEQGVFQVEVDGDLEGARYKYLVNIGGQWESANDPYALASTANNGSSVVVDMNKTDIPLNLDRLLPLRQKNDAVIYELHIRDWSSKKSSGIKRKGKYLGLIEENTVNTFGDSTGLDYLKDLGITHVQLLPIFDFGSVDEHRQMMHYNWGYDPVQYNVPEGGYATDVEDPYCRIMELKEMIAGLHGASIRVVMDVVYNHMFERFSSDFEKLVPYYYFRIGKNGEISNGSFCGNDIDSTRLMMRKYILESIKSWMTHYGIDGFRFDLMGILDIETMNQIVELAESIDPNVMIYGEGWDMPTLLDDDQKATMMNQQEMHNIGHFNDYFRDTIKGGTTMEKILEKGILTGDLKNFARLSNFLLGSEKGPDGKDFFDAPSKSINYVECHDNHTLYDKMVAIEIPEEERLRRHKLIMAVLIFSHGIPFIHAGQEFCRTKNGDHNSYKSSDFVNGIDWDRRTEYHELVDFVKGALELRRSIAVFRTSAFTHQTKVKIKRIKKVVELHYEDGTKLVVNLGSSNHTLRLHDERVVFYVGGLTLKARDEYEVEPLELVITRPGNKKYDGVSH